MSRVSVYEFFGDCETYEYHYRNFDFDKGVMNLAQEPLKKVSEREVKSINEAFAELQTKLANHPTGRLICIFESPNLKIGFHSKGAIKGMSVCYRKPFWSEADASGLFNLMSSVEQKSNGNRLKIFFGQDQIQEVMGLDEEGAGEFFMQFTHSFAEFCRSTGVIPSLTAVLQTDGLVLVKPYNSSEFILVNEALNTAISILRNEGIIPVPQLVSDQPSAEAIDRARKRLAR